MFPTVLSVSIGSVAQGPEASDSDWSEVADPGAFPLINCQACGGERLAFVDLAMTDAGEALSHLCSSCGAAAEPHRYVDDSVLSAFGLKVAAARQVEAKSPKKSGCSNGCGCSTSRAEDAAKGAAKAKSCGDCKGCG